MLLGIVLARMLEPKVFGDYVFVSATLGFVMLPASITPAQLLISNAGKKSNLFEKIYGVALYACFLKFIILCLYILFFFLTGNYVILKTALFIGFPMIFSDIITTFKSDLEGRGIFKPNFWVLLFDLFFNATTSISLIYTGWGIYGLALGCVAGFVPHAAVYTFLLKSKLRHPNIALSNLRESFGVGIWIWVSSVCANWLSRIDKILVGHYAGPTELGFYNRAMNYGPVSNFLLSSLMTNATIRGLANKQSAAEKQRFFFKTMLVAIVGAVVNGVFWFVSAPLLVPFVFGDQWLGAIPSFQILGWLGIPYFIVFGSSTIFYSQREFKKVALINCFGVVFTASLFWFASKLFVLDAFASAFLYFVSLGCTGIAMTFYGIRILFK